MIRFEDVSVRFNNFTAVDGVSLHIEKGDFYGVLGQSGAGKSTLVRTVNMLQKPSSGRVIVADTQVSANISSAQLSALRLRIGMIFQHFNLIKNATVFDNIAFNLKASGTSKDQIANKVPKLLSLVGLSGKEELYPHSLSGGQKQRVAIARALANDPDILLCDEATSALDPDTTNEIIALLKKLKEERNLTVLFITHQMEVAKRLFNKVALMANGKVVEHGSTYDLFAHPSSDYGKAMIARHDALLLPPELIDKEDNLYEITYKEEQAYDSVIAEAIRRFNADISILGGRIEYIGGKPLGNLIISIRKAEQDTGKILDFLGYSACIKKIKEHGQVISPLNNFGKETLSSIAQIDYSEQKLGEAEVNQDELALMRSVKAAIDPNNLFNPQSGYAN